MSGSPVPVVVVPTGTANLASVLAGLERAGAAPVVSADRPIVERAERLVLPGVGTFGAAIAAIDEAGLRDCLRERILAGKPTLAVCVGLQVLCERSEESPGVRGLGVLPVAVGRFREDLRVPQIGWNRVRPSERSALVQPGHAYFANSYRLTETPPGWRAATADYGSPFIAALERHAVLACQFHPELSSAWGGALLRRWVDDTRELEGGPEC